MAPLLLGGILALATGHEKKRGPAVSRNQGNVLRIHPERKRTPAAFADLAEPRIHHGSLRSLADLLHQWHADDPAGLESWLHEHLRSSPDTAEIILTALVLTDLNDLAADQLEELPEPRRASAVDSVFRSIAATDPVGAWNQVTSLRSPGLVEAAQNIILTYGSDAKLPELADLALRREPSATHDGILGNVLSRWVLQDPVAAAGWLNESQVAAVLRDQVAQQLVFRCDSLNRSAETAIAWAQSISDADLRYQAMAASTRELASEQPELAAETIRHSGILTEEEKQSLLANLSSPPRETHFPPPD